jgi:hypothetical protein
MNGYKIARLFHQRYPEISARKVLGAIWASMLSVEDQQKYARGEYTDAQVLKLAHDAGVPGTGPWLEKHGHRRGNNWST